MTPALQELIDEFPCYQNVRCGVDIGDGWVPILRELAPILTEHNVTVSQVKEKFGFLNVYVHNVVGASPDTWLSTYERHPVYAAIRAAEARSRRTCEFCGSTDNVKRAGTWIKTTCAACRHAHLDADGGWRR